MTGSPPDGPEDQPGCARRWRRIGRRQHRRAINVETAQRQSTLNRRIAKRGNSALATGWVYRIPSGDRRFFYPNRQVTAIDQGL